MNHNVTLKAVTDITRDPLTKRRKTLEKTIIPQVIYLF